jgi:hypothetical protein
MQRLRETSERWGGGGGMGRQSTFGSGGDLDIRQQNLRYVAVNGCFQYSTFGARKKRDKLMVFPIM